MQNNKNYFQKFPQIKMINEKEAIKKFNLSKLYFTSLRRDQPKLYLLISSLNEDAIKAYDYFLFLRYSLQKRLETIYFFLEENKLLYRFSKYLYFYNITKNANSFASNAKYTIFKTNEPFKTYKSLKKYDLIEKYFVQFMLER